MTSRERSDAAGSLCLPLEPACAGLPGPGALHGEQEAQGNGVTSGHPTDRSAGELPPSGRDSEARSSNGQSLEHFFAQQLEQIQASLYRLEELARSGGMGGQVPANDAYRKMIRDVREIVRTHVPRGARILVVSRGDDELLNLYGREACHFPADARGSYVGYHPGSSFGAIALLEYRRVMFNAEYLILPHTAFWWYKTYPRFERHLRQHYSTRFSDSKICEVFALEQRVGSCGGASTEFTQVLEECRRRTGTDPATLDWQSGLELLSAYPDQVVFSPPGEGDRLPYLSASIDIVACSGSHPERYREAHRVARSALLVARAGTAPGDLAVEVSWKVPRVVPPRPAASIVIPVFNGVEHTQACLRALAETLPPGFDGEIIVIDDASTDATPDVLDRWARRDPRIKPLRMPSNCGFVECCNRGAEQASRATLIFLNNDTVPLDGWLEALLTVLEEQKDAGVVGGRLLSPDGSLQEAGGLIFRDGSAAHYGRGDHNLDAPMYNWLREVDYCSGALLATRAELFREIGGFDEAFAPGYYEDVEYCFEVRQRGYRVIYQPESVVIHVEGATAGTSLTSGMKKHQLANQRRFVERRRHELAHHPDRPARFDLGSWLKLGMRGMEPCIAR